jgi:hypothetical protein
MSQKEKEKKFEKCGKMKKSVRKLNLFSLCQRLAEEIKTATWEIGDDKI